MKICSKCKKKKDLDRFDNNKCNVDGKAYYCKKCMKPYVKNRKKQKVNKKYIIGKGIGKFTKIDGKLYRDKDWLYDQYINQLKSSVDIAKICNTNHRLILNWLYKFNILVRNGSLSTAIGQYKGRKETLLMKCSEKEKVCLSCEKIRNKSEFKKASSKDGLNAYCRDCDKALYRDAVALYTTYVSKINWCEEVRRDPNNKYFLQVRCTELSCKKWFNPTKKQVDCRVKCIEGKLPGESRLYCSEKCKQTCSIFGRHLYPKGFKKESSRDLQLQQEWRQIVLERDNYKCQRCGNINNLVAHHIEGLNINPLESADIDLGITLCKDCHILAHKDKGCRFADLRNRC